MFQEVLNTDKKLRESSKPVNQSQIEEREEISPDSEIDESPQSPVKEQTVEGQKLENSWLILK